MPAGRLLLKAAGAVSVNAAAAVSVNAAATIALTSPLVNVLGMLRMNGMQVMVIPA